MKRVIASLVCLALLCVPFATPIPASADATEGATLRVACCELDGFFEYDAEGDPFGYGVDLLNEISECSGFKFEYVPADSWGKTKEMLLSGEADLRMPATLPTTFSSTLAYTEESVMDTCHALMTLNARGDLFYKDYENFSSLRVAMTASLYETTDVPDYLEGIGVDPASVILYDEYEQCRLALDEGDVDAVVSNIMDLDDGMKILARFDPVSNYISTAMGSPYLEDLDKALAEIKADNPAFLPALYQEHYPERSAVPYTREEVEFVQSLGALKVGQLEGSPPFSSLDGETGEISGIFVDLCELIAQKSGLSFSYEPVPSGMRAVDWLEQSDGDLVAGVMYSALSSPSVELSCTDTAFSSSVVIIGRQGVSFDAGRVQTIALPKGFIGGRECIAATYPNSTVKTYDSNESCLQAVLSGDADVVFQDIYVARDALQSPRFDELDIFPVYQTDEDMRLVMSQDEDVLLRSVLNKAIGSITPDELDDIIVARTVAEPYQITLEDSLYRFRAPILIIVVLATALLVLLACVIAVRYRSMKRVERKNVQLAEAYEQAQSASRAKSDFLARISHEIRTSMNAIMGIVSLAEDHLDEPEAIREDLDRIGLSSKVLLSILNDVLDASAIESGKIRIARSAFDFKALVSSLAAVYYAQCLAKGVSFEVRIGAAVDERFVGDQLRVSQVLMNLLSNAVKFTDHGSVCLLIEQRTTRGSDAFVSFEVRDTGCGMGNDMLERLWRPFEQESVRTAQKHGGSGLGLAIAKSLVLLMSGAIDVESEKGSGTSFTVTLPFGRCKQDDPPELGGNGKLRILVVASPEDSLPYASAVLRRMGVSFGCAKSGEEALDLLARADGEGEPCDACIIDWDAPGTDGAATARRIRQRCGSVAIVASTYDRALVERDSRDVRIDHILEKPLFQSSLCDLIATLSGGKLPDVPCASSSYDLTGRNVLLAEDNEMNGVVTKGLLKKAGVSCEMFPNGKEAVEAFESSAPGRYDAILLDIQMPVMNGHEAARAIRELDRPDASTIPILALTANAFAEDVSKALQSGMDDHVAKPIEFGVLAAALDKAFRKGGC